MMMKVYKFDLQVKPGLYEIGLPVNSVVLSVKCVRGAIVLYALVDPNCMTMAPFYYEAVWTGHDNNVKSSDTFLGTACLHSGDLIVHYFKSDLTRFQTYAE